MILKFLKSRLFVVLCAIFIVAFLCGYDYAVITSRTPASVSGGSNAVSREKPTAGSMKPANGNIEGEGDSRQAEQNSVPRIPVDPFNYGKP